MEKLSLDSDSAVRGDYRRDSDTHTSVRQTERDDTKHLLTDICYFGQHIYEPAADSTSFLHVF